MNGTILEVIRYTLTLLFGIFVSSLFLDIKINKKIFIYSIKLLLFTFEWLKLHLLNKNIFICGKNTQKDVSYIGIKTGNVEK